MNTQKINVKDLINIGLFSVLIGILTMLGGMIGFIPRLMPGISFVAGLLTGPVYMLFSTKIHKPGILLIQQLLSALFFVVTGHGVWVMLTALLGGLLGELCLKRGGYRSIKWARWAFTAASIAVLGNWFPIFFARDAYIAHMVEAGYGLEFAKEMMSVLPNWVFPLLIVLGALGMYLGCTIGVKLLKKHFVRAGMTQEV